MQNKYIHNPPFQVTHFLLLFLSEQKWTGPVDLDNDRVYRMVVACSHIEKCKDTRNLNSRTIHHHNKVITIHTHTINIYKYTGLLHWFWSRNGQRRLKKTPLASFLCPHYCLACARFACYIVKQVSNVHFTIKSMYNRSINNDNKFPEGYL